MQKRFHTLLAPENRGGNLRPAAGASVTVTDPNGALATIYSDNGVTVAANPLTSSATGYYEYYAADGRYTETIVKTGRDTVTISDILLEDPADSPSPTSADIASTASSKGAGLVGFSALAEYAAGTVGKWLVDLKAAAGSALVGFIQSGTGAVTRTVQDKLRETVSVKDFGATGDGVTDDTAAIQAAISHVSNVGGGVLFFPPGDYMVRKDSPSGSTGTSPDDMALHLEASGVTLLGIKGASRIFSDPSAPARFVPLRVGTIPIVNGGVELSDITIEGLEIDGSYEIPEVGDVADDGNANLWIHGVKRCTLRDLFVHHSSDYGIALQNGGHQDIVIENVVIEDVMADGIDTKNNGDADRGNRMTNVTVRRFGRGTNTSDPFAGIDVMATGWTLTNINVTEYGEFGTPNAGVRFKQGEVGESRGDGAHDSSISNFYIQGEGAGYSLSTGIKVSARGVHIANGSVKDCVAEGVLIEQEDCTVVGVSATGCGDGFRARDYSYTTNGDHTTFVGCTAKGNTRGFVIETSECSMSGCVSRANGTNLVLTAASANNRWLGGEIGSYTTKAVANSGTANAIRNAAGFATATQLESPTVDITTTGDKAVTIPHGLPFAPQRHRCQLTLLRSNNNVTWATSRVMIVSADATNVVCRVAISTASATVGDTATLALDIDSAMIPAL